MKIAAMYLVWDDYQLCLNSIINMEALVDGVIVVASEISNFGERSKIPGCWHNGFNDNRFYLHVVEPDLSLSPSENERAKRNSGLEYLKSKGYTHFIMLDSDEYYIPHEFIRERQRMELNPEVNGLVCASQVYFRSPCLTIGIDTTLVTFITKLTPQVKFERNWEMPYAWDDEGHIRIDPTRMINVNSGIEWSPVIMHHYSYIRKDLRKKIRNSTARYNIENSTLIEDYKNAKEGYYCEFYKKTLQKAENIFNLPEIIDETL